MGVMIVEGEWAVLGVNLGLLVVTSGAFATHSSNYFEDLLLTRKLCHRKR